MISKTTLHNTEISVCHPEQCLSLFPPPPTPTALCSSSQHKHSSRIHTFPDSLRSSPLPSVMTSGAFPGTSSGEKVDEPACVPVPLTTTGQDDPREGYSGHRTIRPGLHPDKQCYTRPWGMLIHSRHNHTSLTSSTIRLWSLPSRKGQ